MKGNRIFAAGAVLLLLGMLTMYMLVEKVRLEASLTGQETTEAEPEAFLEQKPEQFEGIVILDNCGAAVEERRLIGHVIAYTRELLKDTGIGVYEGVRGTGDMDGERRVEELSADLYVGLSFGEAADAEAHGFVGYYNQDYYNQELQNSQVAVELSNQLAKTCSNQVLDIQGAVGLEKDKLKALETLELPAAHIELGFLTNEGENELLRKEAYWRYLGEGLAAGIQEVYRIKNE